MLEISTENKSRHEICTLNVINCYDYMKTVRDLNWYLHYYKTDVS